MESMEAERQIENLEDAFENRFTLDDFDTEAHGLMTTLQHGRKAQVKRVSPIKANASLLGPDDYTTKNAKRSSKRNTTTTSGPTTQQVAQWKSSNPPDAINAVVRAVAGLSCGAAVFLFSPHRSGAEISVQEVIAIRKGRAIAFSKTALIHMDRGIYDISMDLFRLSNNPSVYPVHDLAPLCQYRHLRSLTITGMMQSYQSRIWEVVWLNLYLTDLTLEMEMDGEERLDNEAIRKGRRYALWKPTLGDYVRGHTTTAIPEKLLVVNLSLTGFVMDRGSLDWFDAQRLRYVRLHRCEGDLDSLPEGLKGMVELTVTR